MTDYDKSIHSNPDAQAWAKFFIETVKEEGWRLEHIDEGLMLGWFANAMMAMHDHIRREWVGLTDDEIDHTPVRWTMINGPGDYLLPFARAIEAKLKEKNSV